MQALDGGVDIFSIYRTMALEKVMSTEDILQDLVSLPPEAQRQVADFIAFLLVRYGRSRSV